MTSFEVDIKVTENGRRRPDYTLNSDLNGEITLKDLLEFTKSTLIVTADQVFKDEQARGFDKNALVIVDNRPRKPIEKVNPLGQIEFVARQNMTEILKEAYGAILYRSKVLTGRYKSSHFVFLNGIQVATDQNSLDAWLKTNPEFKQNDLIRIVNIQPYARKLERLGVTAQRSNRRTEKSRKKKDGSRVVAPNGTYFLTARAIRAKYKRNSIIRFTFISGGSLGIAGSFKSGRRGRNSSGRPYLYPTLVISVQERGLV